MGIPVRNVAPRRRGPFLIGLASCVVLAAVGAAGWTLRSSDGRQASRASVRHVVAAPRLAVSVQPTDGVQGVRPDAPVFAAAAGGRIVSASLTGPPGQSVPGFLENDSSWVATAPALLPDTTYQLSLRLVTTTGATVDRVSTFTTLHATSVLAAQVTPGDDDVVGVGMPVIVRFQKPVARRDAIERRLAVESSPPVVGAWSWVSNRELHYRPKDPWPVGTQVSVHADFTGVDAGNGTWGRRAISVHFRIGDDHRSVVDVTRHTMTVTSNGQIVAVFPQSSGRNQYPTMNGTHVVIDKAADVIMDSATNGIPRDSPDGYYEHVAWDVAISTRGEYVHAAPWSVSAQGRDNVSHGCVNLAPDNAKAFYEFSRRGDLITVVGSPRPPDHDLGVVDWNTSWDDWQHGSALPLARPEVPSVAPLP